MTLWLLDTFPTWALFVIVVGAFVLWGVVGLWVVRWRWPALAEGGQNELAGVVVGLVVGIYGIVLAFVIVALYERYDEARSSVREEATQLAQLYRSSKAFPPDVRRIFHESIRRYAFVVVREEYGLPEGREHPHALRELDAMYGHLRRYSPEGPVEEGFYGSVLNSLPELVATRRNRLDYARESLPAVFQVLIFGGAFLLIGFLWFFGTANARAHTAMVVAISTLLGLNILIAVLLDHPFAGDVKISVEPFKSGALAELLRGGP